MHHLHPEQRLAIVRMAGRVTVSDVVGALETVLLDPDWVPGYAITWDALAVRELVPDARGIARIDAIARGLGRRVGTGRSAVVAGGEVRGPVSRYLSEWGRAPGGHEIRLFLDTRAAALWLGVPEALLEGPLRPLDAGAGGLASSA